MIRPSTRLKLAARAANRRRYAWAALRQVRRGLRAALADHYKRSIGAAPYNADGEYLMIRRLYSLSVSRLRQRFPELDFTDPRAGW